MVCLWCFRHRKHRVCEVDQSSTEQQKREARSAENKVSPRCVQDRGVEEVKHDQIPTLLAEKNEPKSPAVERNLAIQSKITVDASRNSEHDPLYNDMDYLSPCQKSEERAKEVPATTGVGEFRDVGGKGAKHSPPTKRGRLEDQVPMIIECWQ